MLTFIQEILDGFENNTITALEFIAYNDSKVFEFKITGATQKTFNVSLPIEWIDAQISDSIMYIDGQSYSKYPLFSEISFNKLKDVLLLNTSLINWSAKPIILSKDQCDYLNRISQRNIDFSQMKDDISLLHYSAMRGDIDVVQLYSWHAKHESELEVKCQNGKTPLDYARENNHLIIKSFLENQIKKLRVLQNRPLRKLADESVLRDDAARRTAVYSSVHEDSSTASTKQGASSVEFPKGSNEPTELPIKTINTPLSDASKQHIFDGLRRYSRLKPNSLIKNIIDAALADMVFPPAFKTKLTPLQLAYQANKDSVVMEALLASAIKTYFEEAGFALFKELLSGGLVPDDWNYSLMRRLAGDEIIIIENPYVEATIQDGKIYWCINFGNQIYYRKPDYEHVISNAVMQNRSWHLTWKEFRIFKDAGKRTGTVSITEERFVKEMLPFVNQNTVLAKDIWQELRNVGILDKKLRLSQAWYPFSNKPILLKAVEKYTCLYQNIANVLQQITNNIAFQEVITPDMIVYRPARVSKTWAKTGRITNKKDDSHITKIWDVGVSRELRDHAVSNEKLPCIADHIPSRSQVKMMCEDKIRQYQQTINFASSNNYYLRNIPIPQDLMMLYQCKNYWENELQQFKDDEKGLPLWSIYITKELDDTGDTTRVCKKDQANLSFYSSVKKHIDDLKKGLKEGTIKLDQLIQALGAFRYMYSRMCKSISNIKVESIFIHDVSFSFFGPDDKARDRMEMDEFFIQEMRSFQN